MAVSFIAGLDLGQASDFTALCVLERTTPDPPEGGLSTVKAGSAMGKVSTIPADPPKAKPPLVPALPRRYALRFLQRFELGSSYPKIVERVVEMFAKPPLAGGTLAIDGTGVGRAVVDMFVRAHPHAIIRPITITAGSETTPDGAGYHVPKKDLVGVLQVLLQGRRLRVARSLPNAHALVRELENFRVKVTAKANETFEAWRERDHDDLVLAVAMAAWIGEHGTQRLWLL